MKVTTKQQLIHDYEYKVYFCTGISRLAVVLACTIIIGVFVLLFAIIIIAVLVYCCFKKKSKKLISHEN